MSAAFIDLAKSVFQVHGVDAQGKVVVTKRLRRDAVLAFFANLAPCVVGMEACAGSHFWARDSVLHGCAGWRKGRPVSMLRIAPSCRTNTMPLAVTIFRGRSGA